jgi:hypothetical protein
MLEVSTLATFGLLDVQATLGALTVPPEASVTLAVNWMPSPSWRLTVAGLTVTEATNVGDGPVASLGVSPQPSRPRSRTARNDNGSDALTLGDGVTQHPW